MKVYDSWPQLARYNLEMSTKDKDSSTEVVLDDLELKCTEIYFNKERIEIDSYTDPDKYIIKDTYCNYIRNNQYCSLKISGNKCKNDFNKSVRLLAINSSCDGIIKYTYVFIDDLGNQ